MRERTFRSRLIAQLLADPPGERPLKVADVGCGTGTLAIALAESGAQITAIDADPRILELARAKPGATAVRWTRARTEALPLEDCSVDRVVFSLVLHHLADATKRSALAEAVRVLRCRGRVHIADWGPPGDPIMRAAFANLQRVDGRGTTQSLADGGLPSLLVKAGFADVAMRDRLRTGWGRLELWTAAKPNTDPKALT
ncbi:MAG TPA: class I SAM-dependent methyltransferase [Solirubrobacteraceae bacterium]|nr:class I SAM-dependent methyltransferase [Solirubrobacteraceae bacterium]